MTMIKRLAALWLLAASVTACKGPSGNRPEQDAAAAQAPKTDTMMPTTDTIEPQLVASWQSFEQFQGKYAQENGMLEKEPLRARLHDLLGKDEPAFKERFKVTPPVEVENGILYNEGCRPHNCGIDEAVLAIDMNRDVIYAGIASSGAVKLYGEKQDSAYPEKLLRWKLRFRAQ